MNAKLTISSPFPPLAAMLRSDAPAGLAIEAPPVVERRGDLLGLPVTINVTVIVDLAQISVVAAAAWLAGRLIHFRSQNLETRANRQLLPRDYAEAEKLIAQEIQNQKDQDDGDK